MNITINSHVSISPFKMSEYSQDAIKNEPMLFNCDGQAAINLGGPITREFVKLLLLQWQCCLTHEELVVDTRVHMLMPRWYPCIPGFHHDDVPRLGDHGQPYYPEFNGSWDRQGNYHADHAMTIVGGTGSFTEFALGTAEFKPVPIGDTVYAQWHYEVVNHLANGKLKCYSVTPNEIVFFDARSWHQGVPATEFGWRYFARASWNTDRTKHCTNEVRRQVQVYLENPMEGW